MKPINVEILMGHSVGIDDSYYRPTENELLQDYLKATDALIMSREKELHREVEKLRVENAEIGIIKKSYLDMKLTLESKDEQVAMVVVAMLVMKRRNTPVIRIKFVEVIPI